MDIKILKFQNKKLAERLEELKCEEENLSMQIEEYKKRERDNTELLSVIHRAWNQVMKLLELLLKLVENIFCWTGVITHTCNVSRHVANKSANEPSWQ